MVKTGRDRDYAACRRSGDGALPHVVDVATPGEDAAILLQGEAVDKAGRDRDYAACRRSRDGALPIIDDVATPGEDAAILLPGKALVSAGRDRSHAASRRIGDGALPGIATLAATPGEDAAVFFQGEAVEDAGRDRDYAAFRSGRDSAPKSRAAAPPGDYGAGRRGLRSARRKEEPDAQHSQRAEPEGRPCRHLDLRSFPPP